MRIHERRLLRTASTVAVIGVTVACTGQRSHPVIDPADQVAVGYDRMNERDVTGSVSSLSGDELRSQRVGRVEELMRDRVPGMQVIRRANGDYSFRIRGTRSLLGNNEPLVVINGMAVSAASMSLALAGIMPLDVVRIDVLKDAGSTAAYGSRGANGVISITTRGHGGN